MGKSHLCVPAFAKAINAFKACNPLSTFQFFAAELFNALPIIDQRKVCYYIQHQAT